MESLSTAMQMSCRQLQKPQKTCYDLMLPLHFWVCMSCAFNLQHKNYVFPVVENYPLLRVFETGVINQHPLMQRADQLDLTKIFNDVAFSKSHSYWAKSLAIELFTLFRAESLAQVAATQTPFAVAMIPLIVKVLLMTKSQTYHDALNTAVNRFFSENFKSFSSHSLEVHFY